MHHLLHKFPELSFSVSATTRAKRKNEIHGVDYYFLSEEEFKVRISQDEFLEWEEVYKSGYYGTLKSEIERIANDGKVAVFDVDVEGGLNIKRVYKENLLDVFVMPPGIEELKKRLHARKTETDSSFISRVLKAEAELKYAGRFSQTIINHHLEEAMRDAEKLVVQFLAAPETADSSQGDK